MVHNISGNLHNLNKVKVCIVFQIRMLIWALGKQINSMEMVIISIAMEKFTKENFNKAKKMEKDCIIIDQALDMKVNGKKIEKMGLVYTIIQMDKDIKVIG